eukprot:TRINITY_DN15541_c0_g1_i1.p1 TRINITY_DN15541_c0_g1~~TRINITY_DN15541_c0_g1_i1.p1  ORF type:complete len:733 (+),score=80.39 TRINITY_DN15541_c0_g1_i1:32-2230(+)
MASSTEPHVKTGVMLELTGAQIKELRKQLASVGNVAKLAGAAFVDMAAESPRCSIPASLAAFKGAMSRPPPPPPMLWEAASSDQIEANCAPASLESEDVHSVTFGAGDIAQPVKSAIGCRMSEMRRLPNRISIGEMSSLEKSDLENQSRVVQNWSALIMNLAEAEMKSSYSELVMRDAWILSQRWSSPAQGVDATVPKEPPILGSRGQGRQSTLSVLRAANDSCIQYLVLHPHSNRVLAWKLLSMLVIFWDMITIPLEQFDLGSAKEAFQLTGYATSSFWVCDLMLSFFTGADHQGAVEMRFSKIAYLYLTSWLPFDLIIVSVDIFLISFDTIMESPDASALAGVRMLRTLRLIRLLRLLRIGKLVKAIHVLANSITNMYALICARILNGLLFMLVVNHFIACAWSALGIAAIGGRSWIERARLPDESFAEVYIAALHWSITQFMPATNSIGPDNGIERVFAVLVVLLAMGVFSSFISSITNSVNALRAVRNEKIQKETIMRQFFSDRDLSTDLFLTIQEFCRQRGTTTKMIEESQVVLLKEVPESLQMRLHGEMFIGTLRSAVWMKHLDGIEHDENLLVRICHLAIAERHVGPRYEVFRKGMDCNDVLILKNDNASYSTDAENSSLVIRNSWLSEVSLWAEWQNAGWLRTSGTCIMVSICCEKFGAVVAKDGGRMFAFLQTFAVLVVGHVESELELGNLVTDLPIDPKILEELGDRANRFQRSCSSKGARL